MAPFRINRFRTLFSKLLLINSLTFMFTCAAQIGIIGSQWQKAYQETSQRLQAGLAKTLAERFSLELESTESKAASLELLHRLAREVYALNTGLDLILVDSRGNVVADLSHYGPVRWHAIDMEPVQKFLTNKGERSFPLFIQHPAEPDTSVTFSAAPLHFRNEPVFLLVLFTSRSNSNTLSIMFQNSTLRTSVIEILLAVSALCAIASLRIDMLRSRFAKISETLRSIAGGDLLRRIEDDKDDELGDISKAVNSVATSLSEQINSLNNKDQLRRELIANIWHDLRGPVTGIQGHVDLFNRAKATVPPAPERYIEVIRTNTDLLYKLLEELHELARLETKELQANCIRCDCEELAESVLSSHQRFSQDKGVDMTLEIEGNPAEIICDPTLIIRALNNLLENALRHTGPGGRITLALRPLNESVELSVTDSGVGISEEALPHLFDRGFQLRSAGTNCGVSGLGLSIVQKIVEAHGSTIQVQSVPGQGTTFSFCIPCANSHAKPPPAQLGCFSHTDPSRGG